MVSNNIVHAYGEKGDIKVTDVGSFVDANGTKNIVGTIENSNRTTFQTLIGLNITTGYNNTESHLVTEPYSKVIYPYSQVPFKFKISSSSHINSVGKPFPYQVSDANVPRYDVVRLNYSSLPRSDGSLIGFVKNIASFDIYNLTIYASAHDKTADQIDSVRSAVIPVLKAGERVPFNVFPDPAVRSKVSFYSCFGVDLSTMNIKIKIGQNRYITSNITGLATIKDIKADPSTGTIVIHIDNQYPVPGPLRLIIPQKLNTPMIFVTMDGIVNRNAVATTKGYTYVDLNIPMGKHRVSVSGIR
ncbi:MAG TPA: hypothetical protein VH500_01145 [Nitrososphaeraceae archaeon]